MPKYVMLFNFTDQGIKAIKESPGRAEAATKALEAMGGKVLGLYYVMGEYDLIGIAEAPNDEVVMTFALVLGSDGNVRTTTLKAFSAEQIAGIVKKLP